LARYTRVALNERRTWSARGFCSGIGGKKQRKLIEAAEEDRFESWTLTWELPQTNYSGCIFDTTGCSTTSIATDKSEIVDLLKSLQRRVRRVVKPCIEADNKKAKKRLRLVKRAYREAIQAINGVPDSVLICEAG